MSLRMLRADKGESAPSQDGAGPGAELRSLGRFRANAFLYLQRRWLNSAAVLSGDLASIALCLSGASALRMWLIDGPFLLPDGGWLLFAVWSVGAASARLLPGWGEGAPEELRRIVMLLVADYGLFTAALFLGKQGDDTSRFVIAGAFLACLVLVPFVRFLVRRLLVARELWGAPAVIYDDTRNARLIVDAFRQSQSFGYFPVAIIDPSGRAEVSEVDGVPVMGLSPEAAALAPVAVVVMPGIDRADAGSLLDSVLLTYSQVLIVPDLIEFPSLWVRALDLGRGLLVLQVTRNELSPFASSFKRLVDLAACLLTAPLWVPLFAMTALALWLVDRSSPIFAQERIGRRGRPFRAFKFRTMVPDAEETLRRALEEDSELRAEWQRHFKLRRDPRVTPMGRLLRRTSLDELPQLLNVVRGEMSLVGPRPLPDYHHEKLSDQVRMLREGVRPGMTGLWQVSGRSESGNEGLERWDGYYVRNWSIWLDAVILFQTVRATLRRDTDSARMTAYLQALVIPALMLFGNGLSAAGGPVGPMLALITARLFVEHLRWKVERRTRSPVLAGGPSATDQYAPSPRSVARTV